MHKLFNSRYLMGFVLAWLWWSISVPKWRLWTLQRVENISQLYMKAVQAGLMWPRGHFFEKTEIRSNTHAIQEQELELIYYLKVLNDDLASVSKELITASHVLQNSLSLPNSLEEKLAATENLKELLSINGNLAEPQLKSYALADFLGKILERYIELLKK